jgi:hypothetical protein
VYRPSAPIEWIPGRSAVPYWVGYCLFLSAGVFLGQAVAGLAIPFPQSASTEFVPLRTGIQAVFLTTFLLPFVLLFACPRRIGLGWHGLVVELGIRTKTVRWEAVRLQGSELSFPGWPHWSIVRIPLSPLQRARLQSSLGLPPPPPR